jgi:hypothetical protein
MPTDDLRDEWQRYEVAAKMGTAGERELKLARNALVSRLCLCYRDGEEWEDYAVWCTHRMGGRCPFYLDLAIRSLTGP